MGVWLFKYTLLSANAVVHLLKVGPSFVELDWWCFDDARRGALYSSLSHTKGAYEQSPFPRKLPYLSMTSWEYVTLHFWLIKLSCNTCSLNWHVGSGNYVKNGCCVAWFFFLVLPFVVTVLIFDGHLKVSCFVIFHWYSVTWKRSLHLFIETCSSNSPCLRQTAVTRVSADGSGNFKNCGEKLRLNMAKNEMCLIQKLHFLDSGMLHLLLDYKYYCFISSPSKIVVFFSFFHSTNWDRIRIVWAETIVFLNYLKFTTI